MGINYTYLKTGTGEMVKMTLTSYNCKHFGEDKYSVINSLVANSTFVLLQELWLYEKQFIDKLRVMNSRVDCVVSSPMNENVTQLGRGKGGVAILWKNNIDCKIEIIACTSKRLCAVKVIMDDLSIMLLNVYMPTDPGNGNFEINEYKDVLQDISVIMLNSDTQFFILGGDWNSDITRNNVQSNTLLSFIEEESLSLCLHHTKSNVPYTFHNAISKSTIDHFFVTNNIYQYITKYESLFLVDDFSDHVPLKLELNINIMYLKEVPRAFVPTTVWQKCSLVHEQESVDTLDSLLLRVNIESESIKCKNVHCNNHKDSISELYNDIIRYCLDADKVLPKTSSTQRQQNVVAGWNEYVKTHKDEAIFWHQVWLDNGRPPQGNIALNRRRTRAKYHYAVKYVDKEKDRIKSNRMAEAIANSNDRSLERGKKD